MSRLLRTQTATLLFSLSTATSALAQGTVVFFDNYVNGRFDEGAAYGLTDAITPTVGIRFSPAQTGYFESLTLPLFWEEVGPNGADIALRAHDPSGFPGATLELFRASNRPSSFSASTISQTFSSSTRPLLSAGQNYWLLVTAPTGGSVLWHASLNKTPLPGYRNDAAEGESLVQWSEPGAFRMTGTAVPEPRITTLLLAGAALVAVRSLRSCAAGR